MYMQLIPELYDRL